MVVSDRKRMKKLFFVLFVFAAMIISCTHSAREPAAIKARVLYIGDSLSMTRLGTYTDQAIRNAGYGLSTYVSCGSKPSSWTTKPYTSRCGYWVHTSARNEFKEWSKDFPPIFATPHITDLLNESLPEVVIFQLGNNLLEGYQELGPADVKNYVSDQVAGLLKLTMNPASGARAQKCIWVSPPDTIKYPENHENSLDDTLKSVISSYGCSFVRGKEFTKYVQDYKGEDGEHYYGKNKSAQMEGLGKKIVEALKKTGY